IKAPMEPKPGRKFIRWVLAPSWWIQRPRARSSALVPLGSSRLRMTERIGRLFVPACGPSQLPLRRLTLKTRIRCTPEVTLDTTERVAFSKARTREEHGPQPAPGLGLTYMAEVKCSRWQSIRRLQTISMQGLMGMKNAEDSSKVLTAG